MQQSIADIKHVFCVGRNYKMHAAELGNAVPSKPIFFMKPIHALHYMDHSEVPIRNDQGSIHYEAELIIHIGKSYKQEMKVEQLVDQVALGIDFTLRDLQTTLKAEGLPWLAAKGFRNSALISRFVPVASLPPLNDLEFHLVKNGEKVQYGRVRDMIFSLQEIVDYCAEHYGLGIGDIIYTGTPAGVAAVADGDQLQVQLGEQIIGASSIKLV